MAVRTISNAGGLWNATTAWVEGVVPTNADDVVATATSGNLTINVQADCRSIDLTGYTGTLTHNSGIDLRVGGTTQPPNDRALKFVPGMTYTRGNPVTSGIVFRSNYTATAQKIDFGGKSVSGITFAVISGSGAPSWVLESALSQTNVTAYVNHQRGHVNTGGFQWTIGTYASNAFTSTRSLTLNNSVIQVNGTGTVWNTVATGYTVNPGTSTLWLSNMNGARTFIGGGKAYGIFAMNSDADSPITVQDNNTFESFSVINNASGMLKLTSGSIQTVLGTLDTLTGAAGNLFSVQATTAGTPATISKASGTVQAQYLSLKDITASGGAAFYAPNSTDLGGNTGWTFGFPDTAAPNVTLTVMPDKTTISRQAGQDVTSFQFQSDEAFTAYELRAVPSPLSPHTAGTLLESGGAGAAGTPITVDITDDELVNAGVGEGRHGIAVFVRDAAGNWSPPVPPTVYPSETLYPSATLYPTA